MRPSIQHRITVKILKAVFFCVGCALLMEAGAIAQLDSATGSFSLRGFLVGFSGGLVLLIAFELAFVKE